MSQADAHLLLLAQAVADDTFVDWAHEESSAPTPNQRLVISQLRTLAALGAAAREQAAHWGPLEIRGEVGRGTFGTVYRAWDPRLDREVALKVLRQENGERLLASAVVKEGRLLAQINHPNVVTVHGADEHDGSVGIWMEFVTGRTLKEIVDKEGPFSPHEAVVIGRDVCRALAAVHQRGFLHRDVKAQNVMREAGGRTVLMDFGAGEVASVDLTRPTTLAGTPVYLAPEVLAGGSATVKSDLYSLGVLLYYLVSGGFPVTGSSLDDLRERHAQRKRTLLRDVRPNLPPEIVRVVDRATATDPAERPESAGAMELLLETALDIRGSGAARDETETVAAGPSTPARPRSLSSRRIAYALAVGALLAIAWGVRAGVPWRTSGAAAVSRNSVAILPFRNLTSAGHENDYFTEGISDDLVAQLAMLRDLRIISGASMRRYRDGARTETEIGTELGVAAVLDGSVRQSGDRVRIVGRLIDARTGEQIWSESFERDLKDIFTMQSEVARKIAVALKGQISQPDEALIAGSRVRDVEAYKLYLKGRYYWGLRTEDGINRALQHFNDAIARDPNYAAAYAGLSDAYTSLGVYGVVPRVDAYARAATAAEKAIALDPTLAEAHASLAYVHKNRFEWARAEAGFRRAIELKPGYASAHHWYSIFLTQQGRFPEAITEVKTALFLDPLSIAPNMQLASALLMARRFADAIAQYERALTMTIDAGAASAYRVEAQTYAYMGRYDDALETAERAAKVTPAAAEDQELKAVVGYVYAVSGRRAEALAIANEFAERYRRTGEEIAASVAAIYAGLGEIETALDWLGRACDARDPEVGYLKVEPRWDRLRDTARFKTMLARLGLAS